MSTLLKTVEASIFLLFLSVLAHGTGWGLRAFFWVLMYVCGCLKSCPWVWHQKSAVKPSKGTRSAMIDRSGDKLGRRVFSCEGHGLEHMVLI